MECSVLDTHEQEQWVDEQRVTVVSPELSYSEQAYFVTTTPTEASTKRFPCATASGIAIGPDSDDILTAGHVAGIPCMVNEQCPVLVEAHSRKIENEILGPSDPRFRNPEFDATFKVRLENIVVAFASTHEAAKFDVPHDARPAYGWIHPSILEKGLSPWWSADMAAHWLAVTDLATLEQARIAQNGPRFARDPMVCERSEQEPWAEARRRTLYVEQREREDGVVLCNPRLL